MAFRLFQPLIAAAVALEICAAAFGQPEQALPEFEVASIKPSPPPDGRGFSVFCKGGPGSTDPGLFTCTNFTVANLISLGFNLRPYQMAADFGDRAMYEISAKVPPGATREQFDSMLRKMVIDRFKLAYHFEKKEMQIYDLTIAKGGLKMRDSPPLEAEPETPTDHTKAPDFPKTSLDADGFPKVPKPKRGSSMTMMSKVARWTASGVAMAGIIAQIEGQMRGAITDSTGLKGTYDFTLSWATDTTGADAAGPSFVEALQSQLGLKLEREEGHGRCICDRSPGEDSDRELRHSARIPLAPFVGCVSARQSMSVWHRASPHLSWTPQWR
ncbi:MAG: TIGR03435 family protein [Ignavibacteriota bacterium]